MFAAIDTGTTNTRVYIIDDGKIVGRAYKKVGVRDTVISGSKDKLKQGIAECFEGALQDAEVILDDIDYAVASGMIITEIGLIDIPHLSAPVGFAELADNAVVMNDTDVFPIDIPVVFIPGIKNNFDKDRGMLGLRYVDFMKGEETQVMGMLEKLKPKLPCNIFIFSSHTKMIHVDEKGKITASITTMSGQVYEALKKQTFIGKSIDDENADFFSDKILETAYDCVNNAGFIRTLMMPRFMEILLDTKGYERRFFAEAAIASEDIKILGEADYIPNMDKYTDYIFVGHKIRCEIYEKLLRRKGLNSEVTSIYEKEKIDEFAVLADVLLSETLIKSGRLVLERNKK